MAKDPYQSRYDMRDGFVGGIPMLRGKSRGMFPIGGIVVPLVAMSNAYSAATSPVLLAKVVSGAPVAGIFDDIAGAFEDAASWTGQAFEDLGDWLADSWDTIKRIADLGVTLMHVAALICACTGIGVVVSGAIEAAALGVQLAIDESDKQIQNAIALGDMAEDAAKAGLSVVSDARNIAGKVNAITGVTLPGSLPTLSAVRKKAASGDLLSGVTLASVTLTKVFGRLVTLNPMFRSYRLDVILATPAIRKNLPESVQALLLWGWAVKTLPSPQVAPMTKAVGAWLAWKTETINDISFRILAKQFGMVSAATAVADFSMILPAYPAYKQFTPDSPWLSAVRDMTPAKRVEEVARIARNYPEPEALAAFEALRLSAPSPSLATAAMLHHDPSAVNKLYQVLPPPVPSVAYVYNPTMGGFNYDSAMKGSQAANLSKGDKARWLALLITDNMRLVDARRGERLKYLSASARGMGADFGPPVVMGPFTPIDADALAKAASAFTADKGTQLRTLAATLRNWATGYDQRAAAYALKLEADRLAAKKASEDGQAAMAALLKQAARESAENANSDIPRTREGIYVDLDSKTTKKGKFSYAGPIQNNQKTCVVSADGTCDVGLWADA